MAVARPISPVAEVPPQPTPAKAFAAVIDPQRSPLPRLPVGRSKMPFTPASMLYVRADLPRARSDMPPSPEAISDPSPYSPLPSILPVRRSRQEFSFAFWTALRPRGSVASIAESGQLGGSQAGMRVMARPLGSLNGWTVSPTIRMSRAIGASSGDEIAMGTAIATPRFPLGLRLFVERRIKVGGGGRDAFAAFATVGGLQSLDDADLQIEGYGQAGVVGLNRADLFADGAATISRPIPIGEPVRLSVGGGVWGGIQPGIHRVDMGPSAAANVDLGTVIVRVQIDWRFRVAGRASPPSGPALTIGASF